MCYFQSYQRFVSRVEEVLNEWKLIGNSEEKRLFEKVGNCHGAIHSSISIASYICSLCNSLSFFITE